MKMVSRDRLMKSPYFLLPKQLYVLFLVRAINSFGSLIFPFMTLFLTRKLSMDENISGIYVTMAFLAFAPGSLLGGKAADRYGRKSSFIVFQTAAAVCILPCAFIGSSIVVPYLLIMASLFIAGAQPAGLAMATDLTNGDTRKTAFSLMFLGTNVGVGAGGILAGLLFTNYTNLLFSISVIAILLSVVLVVFLLDETLPSSIESEQLDEEHSSQRNNESLKSILLKSPLMLFFGVVTVLYTFIFSQHSFSLPLQLDKTYDELGSKIFGIVMMVNTITIISMTIFVTYTTRKINTFKNIILAGGLFAIGFGMVGLSGNMYLLIISTFIWSTGEILFSTNLNIYIADHSPDAYRARYNSVFNIISGAGYALGPVCMGWFINSFGIGLVWPFISIFAVFSMFFMYIINVKFEKNNYVKNKMNTRSG